MKRKDLPFSFLFSLQITGYPTLLLFSDGVKKAEYYDKERDLELLINFLHGHK